MVMSLGAVGANHVDGAIVVSAGDLDAPRIATDLAVLNKAAVHVRFDVDLDLFAAVWTSHDKLI
jgi:hypothetical protein